MRKVKIWNPLTREMETTFKYTDAEMKKDLLPTEQEARDAFDKMYESFITSFQGISPISGEGYNGWKIKAWKSAIFTNDAGLALFKKCLWEEANKQMENKLIWGGKNT